MLKKASFFLVFFFTLFFAANSSVSAQSCGDQGTIGLCGGSGGCAVGSYCRDPLIGTTQCEPADWCANADNSQNVVCGEGSSDYKCGPSAGCVAGYMCRDPFGPDAYCTEIASDATDPSCLAQPREPGDPNGPPASANLLCGDITSTPDTATCGCTAAPSGGQLIALDPATAGYCCGWNYENRCYQTEAEYQLAINSPNAPAPTPTPLNQNPGSGGDGGGGGSGGFGDDTDLPPSSTIDIFDGPTETDFRSLNPLEMFGNDEAKALTSPGAIVARMLLFAFPLAGLILFIMIVWGGFEMLTSAASKGIEAGRQRVTAAIVGFVLLFVAYWVFQIIEIIFGVVIL